MDQMELETAGSQRGEFKDHCSGHRWSRYFDSMTNELWTFPNSSHPISIKAAAPDLLAVDGASGACLLESIHLYDRPSIPSSHHAFSFLLLHILLLFLYKVLTASAYIISRSDSQNTVFSQRFSQYVFCYQRP